MNRIQFWILTGLSGLVLILLVAQIALVRMTNFEQNRLALAQQVISQGQASQSILKQLAIRIFQDSQKYNDSGLKDLMARQQITYNPGDSTNSTEAPASPATTPAPATH